MFDKEVSLLAEQKKKTRIVIIILAVLLGLSLLALGAVLIHNKSGNTKPVAAYASQNIVIPNKENSRQSDNSCKTKSKAGVIYNRSQSSKMRVTSGKSGSYSSATLALYNKKTNDNLPFEVSNMFPGDEYTKYFRVRVSYRDTVTVHYRADVRNGFEKLPEVLKIRIMLLSSGETLYDGLIKDMPKSLPVELVSEKSTTQELNYEITAYLENSVGNEYQNKNLIADFKWWVEGAENLENSPKTGEEKAFFHIAFAAALFSFVLVLLLLVLKRKEEKNDG